MEPGSQSIASDAETNQKYQFWLGKIVRTQESVVFSTLPPTPLGDSEYAVVECKFGVDLARICGSLHKQPEQQVEQVRFLRAATESDVLRAKGLREKEIPALAVFREKVEQHRLPMKPVEAHFLFDEDKLILFFTADNRVDFRELVRDLVSHFHLRIELRQIGVRDESRMVGGRGVCGRCLCCHGVSDQLQPVSIKMAKTQNLSLNSVKISGPCGRLLCCLAFEYEAYRAELTSLPREADWLSIGEDQYRIVEINAIQRSIVALGMEGQRLSLRACELSSGEAPGRWTAERPSEA